MNEDKFCPLCGKPGVRELVVEARINHVPIAMAVDVCLEHYKHPYRYRMIADWITGQDRA